MDLCIIVLTHSLGVEPKPPKFIPKVCYKIGEKSMIEICLENVVKINPSRIILMISKYDIFYINKIIKHAPYAKLISFCVFNTNIDRSCKISLTKHCYKDKNILVVPGNAPLLSAKSLYKIISEKRNIKINNSLFYLRKDYISEIDSIGDYSTGDEEFLPFREIKQIETKKDFDDLVLYYKKGKYFKKIGKSLSQNNLDRKLERKERKERNKFNKSD